MSSDRSSFAAGFGSVTAAVGLLGLVCAGMCIGVPCLSTGFRYGLWLEQCPVGEMRFTADVSVNWLVRGQESTITVTPSARYVTADPYYNGPFSDNLWRGYDVSLSLLDDEAQPLADGATLEWVREDNGSPGTLITVKVPAVPDGDYILRATLDAGDGPQNIDVPVALYAPALAHVMTDRPLYKPGQEVLLRSALFRRTDLAPIEHRPGKWRVTSPDGTEMLIEKDSTGPWGVADSSFPLDDRAQVGQWSATFMSGAASDTVHFDVRPFRLPRLVVEAKTPATWYAVGEEVVIEGTARYGSGAPVQNAKVDVRLGVSEGRWPVPLDWEEPFSAVTDSFGRWRIVIGDVPADLVDKAVLGATVTVTDDTGESAIGGTRVVLSQRDLIVEAVTELGDGLVGGFNNRAYLRVTTPDGTPVPKARVKVTPWWDPDAKAHEGQADEDGVAALQLDPGDPVTVVIPAPPWRERPVEPNPPSFSGNLDLEDHRALEARLADFAACGDFVTGQGSQSVGLGVRIGRSGAVERVMTVAGPAPECVKEALGRVRFASGGEERTEYMAVDVPDTLRPSLYSSTSTTYGDSSGVDLAFTNAALYARRCLPRGSGLDGAGVLTVHWATQVGSKAVSPVIEPGDSTGLSATQLACVQGQFGKATLDRPATAEGMGTTSVSLSVPHFGSYRPQDQTTVGYQLRVTAVSDGEEIGEGQLIMPVGNVPSLRIRATPTLASPGDQVTFELLRGPGFYGELPEELWLMEGSYSIEKQKVDADKRTVTYTIPADRDGFMYVEYNGSRAVVFVQPKDPLAVELTTDKGTYAPGETAKLTVRTTAGGQPVQAGVGLVGVDQQLGALATLLGPDDFGRVLVRETSDQPAFGAFSPQALVLGDVRGENAAKAAVMRISTLPMDPAGDDGVYGFASSPVVDADVLARNFYRALDKATTRVEAWEASAPEGEVMDNERMADIWDAALADLDGDDPAVDVFARPLTLGMLPPELLRQVDPRAMVGDATRLPEDVIDWAQWVSQEGR